MSISAISWATDAELARYESEVVTLASEYAVSFTNIREAVVDELTTEFYEDYPPETSTTTQVPANVIDNSTDRARALRRYATRKALRIFWEDVASGRESTAISAKAERARHYEELSRAAFRAVGWPLDTDADSDVDDSDDQRPVVLVGCR